MQKIQTIQDIKLKVPPPPKCFINAWDWDNVSFSLLFLTVSLQTPSLKCEGPLR